MLARTVQFQALVVGLACLCLTPVARANLVANGDFETPSVPAVPGYVCYANSTIDNWTSSGAQHGSCYIQQSTGPFGPAFSGSQYMYVNDFGVAGTKVEQQLALVGGTTYRLTFAEGGVPGFSPVAGLAVTLGTFEAVIAPRDGNSAWEVFSYDYTPLMSGPALLAFASTTSGYVTIDNVTVVAVPEPQTYALLLAGLAGLALATKRRRR